MQTTTRLVCSRTHTCNCIFKMRADFLGDADFCLICYWCQNDYCHLPNWLKPPNQICYMYEIMCCTFYFGRYCNFKKICEKQNINTKNVSFANIIKPVWILIIYRKGVVMHYEWRNIWFFFLLIVHWLYRKTCEIVAKLPKTPYCWIFSE